MGLNQQRKRHGRTAGVKGEGRSDANKPHKNAAKHRNSMPRAAYVEADGLAARVGELAGGTVGAVVRALDRERAGRAPFKHAKQ